MGEKGKAGDRLRTSYWKGKTGANTDCESDAMAITVNASKPTDTLHGSMRAYFVKEGGIAGGDWRDNMRATGSR